MKNKIVSFILWIILGIIITQSYSYFFNQESTSWPTNSNISREKTRPNISSMNDEQLEAIAEKEGITIDELKEKSNSGNINVRPNSRAGSWTTQNYKKWIDQKYETWTIQN